MIWQALSKQKFKQSLGIEPRSSSREREAGQSQCQDMKGVFYQPVYSLAVCNIT